MLKEGIVQELKEEKSKLEAIVPTQRKKESIGRVLSAFDETEDPDLVELARTYKDNFDNNKKRLDAINSLIALYDTSAETVAITGSVETSEQPLRSNRSKLRDLVIEVVKELGTATAIDVQYTLNKRGIKVTKNTVAHLMSTSPSFRRVTRGVYEVIDFEKEDE